jgi:hypothetical protein
MLIIRRTMLVVTGISAVSAVVALSCSAASAQQARPAEEPSLLTPAPAAQSLPAQYLYNVSRVSGVPSAGEIVRRSDFIGFVQAEPLVSDLSGAWGQFVTLTRVTPIKGILSRPHLVDDKYPLIFADEVGDPPRFSQQGDYEAGSGGGPLFPTRFDRKGEYLVFLRRDRGRQPSKVPFVGSAGETSHNRNTYTTIAAFAVEVRPDAGGKPVRTVIGVIGGSSDSSDTAIVEALSADTARALLERAAASLAKGEAVPTDVALPLDQLFQRAAAQSVRFPFIVSPSRPRTISDGIPRGFLRLPEPLIEKRNEF